VLKYCAAVSLVLGGILIWSAGCQSDPKKPAPGALPAKMNTDAGPRLNASTYFAHGHLLERQGNYEGAVEQYQRALALSPNMVSARNRLGICLNKLGRHAEASAQFRLAIQQNHTDGYLQNNLGFSLYLEGKNIEALAALAAAIELQPDYGRAHMNKGIVLAKMGDYPAALTEFTLAAGEADAHYNLGVIQSEDGDYAAAAHSLESALKLNPGFEAARQQLRVVARLAAGVEASPVEAPALAVVEPDDGAAPPPSPAEALVADSAKPDPTAGGSAGGTAGSAARQDQNISDRGPSGDKGRQPVGPAARRRSAAQPPNPTSKPVAAAQPAPSADPSAQELRAEIIRRIMLAKVGG
jgi:tetratricopeptide (TPR) repeat protein